MLGWHHRLDGREFEQALGVGDGQGGLACCSPWGWKSQTRLSDWTELNWKNSFKSMLIGRCSRWLKRKFGHFLPTSCLSSCLLCWADPKVLVPKRFGTRDQFRRWHFFHGPGWGWFQGDSSILHLLHTLLLLLLHHPYLRLSGIRSPWFGTLALKEGLPRWLSGQKKNLLANARDASSIPGLGRFPWRREWQPTAVFLPGESHGQRSLLGYSPWRLTESDTTGAAEHARCSVACTMCE